MTADQYRDRLSEWTDRGTNSRLRLGIAPCLEVLLDMPTYVAPVSGSGASGFTDVAPAVKWQISPVPGKFGLSVVAGVALPTGAITFVFAEYIGDFPLIGGVTHRLNFGGGVRITPTQQIDFHAGIGLDHNAPAYVFGIGYSFRFDGLFTAQSPGRVIVPNRITVAPSKMMIFYSCDIHKINLKATWT
jgi:hypothetical protein